MAGVEVGNGGDGSAAGAVAHGRAEVRRRTYRAPTPREQERWHTVWLLLQGWTAAAMGRALERDGHTIGQWTKAFAEGDPKALVFEQTGGSP